LATGIGVLKRAHGDLNEKWAETKTSWNDAMSRQFEEDHLRPLSPQMQLTLAAIHRFQAALADAEKDCADNEHLE
jgi:hypothetical protein